MKYIFFQNRAVYEIMLPIHMGSWDSAVGVVTVLRV